jgi:glycosyltransferase involved in cell wall biosynthesis
MIRAQQPAAIITSSPPGCVHVLGMRLSKRFGLPWIADFRDPWVTNRPPSEVCKLGPCDAWLERRAMKQASVLVANTPLNQAGWAKAFPEFAAKIVTIPNGFDPERFVGVPTVRKSDNIPTMLHAGELYYGRDPRPLLDALKILQSGPERLPLQIDFVGRATEGTFDLAEEIRTRVLEDCVSIHGQMPYTQAIQRMLGADILLLLQAAGHPLGVPAKLYEYLGAGRPILALAEPEGDIAWALRTSKVLHRIAPPTDVERIKQALVELTGEIKAGLPAVPEPAALQQFTRERMAQRFAECLQRCTTSDPAVQP